MGSMRFASLSEWLVWLESLHPKEIDLGLARVKHVAATMNLLAPAAKVITVAGTNGKGSFVNAISELLLADGATVGAFTSPHFLRYNERIAINGEFASDEAICEAFQAIDQARGETSLTYFEFGTLAALYLFQRANLDYFVLEVGLGGRLDAANIIDADFSVITSIDLDHEAWLGNDREVIGREKAGILRENRPAICVDSEIPESVTNCAQSLVCKKYFLGEELIITNNGGSTQIRCTKDETKVHTFLLRDHQLPLPSLAAAAQTYCLLNDNVDSEKVSCILERSKLAGRFEILRWQEQNYILDVAHNPQAARLLASRLIEQQIKGLVVIFTCMQDKNLSEIVKPLQSLVEQWVCTTIPNLARSRTGEDVAQELTSLGQRAVFEASPEKALERALGINKNLNQPILVLGSFFLISEIKPLLGQS